MNAQPLNAQLVSGFDPMQADRAPQLQQTPLHLAPVGAKAVARQAKKLECLAVAAFGAPRLPVCLLPFPPPDVSYSFLMASNHFWGSTEIDENVSLTLL